MRDYTQLIQDQRYPIHAFMKERKKFRLAPILMMLLLGGLNGLTQGSTVASFIFTLF